MEEWSASNCVTDEATFAKTPPWLLVTKSCRRTDVVEITSGEESSTKHRKSNYGYVSRLLGKTMLVLQLQSGVVLVVERWLTEGLALIGVVTNARLATRSGGAMYTDVNFIVNVAKQKVE